MPKALPSLRSVQRVLYSEYKSITEGEFRFKELADHLAQHKATNVVLIGEDATRLIARVEWDAETNRCCGFVLPLNKEGLPESDSFLAVSFEGIEKMFVENSISKYAYVYMAQSLLESCPPFCLMLMGTDNKFTTESVLQRWKYIVNGCKKNGIDVASFGGDGDSRLLKAMRLSVDMFFATHNDPLALSCPVSPLKFGEVPLEWKSWFFIKPSASACGSQIEV